MPEARLIHGCVVLALACGTVIGMAPFWHHKPEVDPAIW
jgi:hypothetical protein